MNDTNTKTDRDRAMDRILKCMRLSQSSEAHEAAAALRQAQALMRKFSIDENELHGIEVKSVLVLTPEPPKTRFPMYLSALVALICRAFDAQAIFEVGTKISRGQLKYYQGVRYFVAGGRAPLVEYTHEVCWRQLWDGWNKYRKEADMDFPPGARTSFWMGWIAAVNDKVMDFGATEKEKEIVEAAISKQFPNLKASKVQPMELKGSTLRAGHEAAKDFSLNRPMGGEKQKLLN